MNSRIILLLIIGVDALILFFKASELSISYYEASLLYDGFSFLQLLINSSLLLFGENDFALRFPMIVLHSLSAMLLYAISSNYLKNERSRLWLVLIFILLPGVISSAIVVNSAGLVIFGLLLFIYLHVNNFHKSIYPLLVFYLIIDGGFLYLFLSLSIYALYTKQKKTFIFSIVLSIISMYIYGLSVHGSPKGHFLDAIGVYAAIFSPIVFIYLFYVLYRRYLTKEIDILWFIASTALIISLLLSFRQKVDLELFAPYLIVALPLLAQTFYRSYRVRLKQHRKNYRLAFVISLIFLFGNSFIVLFNQTLYLVLENPKKHFAYKFHIAKDIARELKSKGIECVKTSNRMSNRLKFYGIKECDDYKLVENIENNTEADVTVSYKNRILYFANVTNINNK